VIQLSPAGRGHRGGRTQKLAVPDKGAIKTGLERELRSPVEDCAGSLALKELMTNFSHTVGPLLVSVSILRNS
jgi:hypothetical protein